MVDRIFERPFVSDAIGIFGFAFAFDTAIDPFASVFAAVFVIDRTDSVRRAIRESTIVDRTVGIGRFAFPLNLTIAPIADILIPIGQGEGAFAVLFSVYDLTRVLTAIGIFDRAAINRRFRLL